MADSEDEYDRKRRDKFRGERSDYREAPSVRRPPPPDDMRNSRQDWNERDRDWNNRGGRGRSIDYRLGSRPQPHEFSPPNSKRPRVEWDRYSHDSFGSSGYGSYDQPPPQHSFSGGHGGHSHKESSSSEPQLLSFKSWLSTQDDTISDQEALSKYAEYKQEFKRQELNEFFVAHKDEEWFKNKYHPDDSSKRKEEHYQNLKKRVSIFVEFLNAGKFNDVTLDSGNSEKIVKLMDWFVVRLEGGSDEDAAKLLSDEIKKQFTAPVVSTPTPVEEKTPKEEKAVEENGAINEDDENAKEKWSGSDSEDESKKKSAEKTNNEDGEEKDGQDGDGEIDDSKEEEKDETKNEEVKEEETNVIKPPKEEIKEIEETPQLHRTSSVFLRNLAPTITKQEVEALCKKYPGFLRIALADPQPDRRWLRRGWVTFKRNVNIKEICWNFNNVRLRDTELGPIVNRDLSRRVRTVNGITPHKTIVRNDIRLAAKVIQYLDAKLNLWDEDSSINKEKESYGVYSTNPVLKNITDYLIEEASAEEEELLGQSMNDVEGTDKNLIERDEELIRVLDRLLFYLRFVHSVDYYNHSEYPYEDDMPNRLGLIHARGLPPGSKVNMSELQGYNRNFEAKILTLVEPVVYLTDEECKVYGTKDENTEVEKFISSNTQELGKDKWLCPLSGKKFKGPEFVRKHILNKHGEKVDEVIKEVAFFNNFLRDPKRPQTPDKNDRSQQHQQQQQQQPLLQQPGPPRHLMMQDSNYPPYGGYYHGQPPPRQNYGGGGFPQRDYPPPLQSRLGGGGGRAPYNRGRDHGRPMISYRDLDAPAEPDDF